MELIKLTFIFGTVIFPQSDGAAFAHCLCLEQSPMGAVVGEPNTALSKTDDPTFTQTHTKQAWSPFMSSNTLLNKNNRVPQVTTPETDSNVSLS